MRKKRMRGKLSVREAIIAILAAKGSATLDYLEEKTRYNKNLILVTLTKMAQEGIITRSWMKYGGKKFRIYRLRAGEELVS
ncbi:hypothetical protein HS7_20420 [Sulfolobales archaeon HS-7]|nr:hypothetical protein HS7_20420 [Sulfolobales archaeon HS-7]